MTMDLNLLRIFDALAVERSVTRAARRVGLSQPAFSHALARLRRMLGDRLFVRVPRGMVPTPRAIELHPIVRDLLVRADRLAQPVAFDPMTCTRAFRIATTDYFEAISFPRIAVALSRAAPRASLVSLPTGGRLPTEQFEEGRLDLAIAGFFRAVPDGYHQQKLFDETFVCLVRADHPTVRSRLSLSQYTKLSHVLISPGGDLQGVVDEQLASRNERRHVAVGVSSFLSAGSIVAKSDLVLTAPRRLAAIYAPSLPLRSLAPPLPLPGFTVVQVWHGRHQDDPAHRFLRRLIAEELRTTSARG
jgi:DNA-binding transcriptional LysR family regulator